MLLDMHNGSHDCRATLNTLDNIHVNLPDAYNHPKQQTKLKVDNVLQSINKRCREETTPIPTIYDQEVNKLRKPEWNIVTHKVVERLHVHTFESSRGYSLQKFDGSHTQLAVSVFHAKRSMLRPTTDLST